MAARANYLSADRPDIQYAVKEICRRMASPVQETGRSWSGLDGASKVRRGAFGSTSGKKVEKLHPDSVTAIGPETDAQATAPAAESSCWGDT